MKTADQAILQSYAKLTEFLGAALGPDHEVALHDLTDRGGAIVAIANSHVSGRDLGAPLTSAALAALRDKSYETEDYRVHNYGISVNGKSLRSNTMFIKQEGRLIGMLCINFDDSRYRAVTDLLLSLCHPDRFVADMLLPLSGGEEQVRPAPDTLNKSIDEVVRDAVNRELARLNRPADGLSADERMEVIAALEHSGIFLLKGAVKCAAALLHCSQASMYRYIAQLKKPEGAEK